MDNDIITPLNLNKPIEIGYICRTCKQVFFISYHIKEIIAKRLRRGRFIDTDNLTVAGLGLPKILYCPGGECRRNRHGN